MTISPADAVLLCPRNDEESLQILKIAQAMELATVISAQPHGARLQNEEHLIERLRAANPNANTVVIVEIPGPEVESQLQATGYKLVIIDHHRYEGLDRMKMESSLDQFLTLFDLDNEQLRHLGFDPSLVRGVGAIDRGFLWELKKIGYSPSEARRARDYYRALGHELGDEFARSETAAKEAWDNKTVEQGIFVYRSPSKDLHIREAISFLVADHYDEPPTGVILEGDGQITVQDSPQAQKLFNAFGGYLFGQNQCWGFKPQSARPTPTLSSILEILLS